MSEYVWCKKEESRLPIFRCFFCGKTCYPEKEQNAKKGEMLETLLETGRFKECFVMKRKGNTPKQEAISVVDFEGQKKTQKEHTEKVKEYEGRIFLMENEKLELFSPEGFTTSTLYHEEESYSIERKLVRPRDQKNIVFAGKKPSKVTVPIIVTKNGDYILLESWAELDSRPEQLADAEEVIGAIPVKQVFVLVRR